MTGLAVSISNDKNLQPKKDYKLSFSYRDNDIAGHTESRLVIGRYDEIHKRWVLLPTVLFDELNQIEAIVNHFSIFAVIELVPAPDLGTAKSYPNPFTPAAGANLLLDALTANATVTIFNIMGEKICDLSDDNDDGRIFWNGCNNYGNTVASGIYFAVLKSGSETRTLKIAVRR